MLRYVAIVLLAALSAACSTLPSAEFQAYRDSFAAAQTAAAPINENYAVRERAEWRRRLSANRSDLGFFVDFRTQDAELLSSRGLPPGADAADRAFAALARYNDLLVYLAENRNIDEARAQLQQLTSELSGIVPGALPQSQLDSLAGLAVEVFRPIIQEDNRQQFRLRVVDGLDEMVALIDELRELAPHQYMIITRPLQDRARLAEPADLDPLVTQINDWHQVFTDYVFLLNAVEERLNLLADAARNPRPRPVLERAAAGATDLRSYADALRRSVTALNAPR